MFSIPKSAFTPRELEFLETLGESTFVITLRALVPRLVDPPAVIKQPNVLGEIGEEEVFKTLSHYQISNVTRAAHSGDFLVTHRGVTIMVEVKNYATRVPTKEVEKFEADLERSNATMGLLVSLKSEIMRIGSFHFSDGRKRAIIAYCPHTRLVRAYTELLFAGQSIEALAPLELDVVQRLSEKLCDSMTHLFDVRNALSDAERAIQRARALTTSVETETAFYLDKLMLKTNSLSAPLPVTPHDITTTITECVGKNFPASFLAKVPSLMDALLAVLVPRGAFNLALEKTKFRLTYPEGPQIVVRPCKTLVSIELRVGTSSRVVRATSSDMINTFFSSQSQ